MRTFVTGLGGFVGRHLLRHLEEKGDEVSGLAHLDAGLPSGLRLHDLDVRDGPGLELALAGERPEAVVHLAAVSHVGASWERRRETLETNLLGALALLEAARSLDPRPRILLVGSSEEYGAAADGEGPIDETTPLRPVTPYGVSKAAQELLGLQMALTEGLPVVLVRAFNHTGPGQAPTFVVPEWARAIAEMEAGRREPVLEVGNLAAVRDFCDVRDVVRLYRLLVEKGRAGEVYNVCSGTGRPLAEVLESLRRLARVRFEVRPRPGAGRKGDVRALVGSRRKAQVATGWEPRIPFEQTLADVLDDWRGRVAAGETWPS